MYSRKDLSLTDSSHHTQKKAQGYHFLAQYHQMMSMSPLILSQFCVNVVCFMEWNDTLEYKHILYTKKYFNKKQARGYGSWLQGLTMSLDFKLGLVFMTSYFTTQFICLLLLGSSSCLIFFFFGPLSEMNHTLIEEESEPCCSYLWMIFPSLPLKLLLVQQLYWRSNTLRLFLSQRALTELSIIDQCIIP